MTLDRAAVVERLLAAWSRGDMDGVIACCTEDCVFQFLAGEWSFEGHDGVRAFLGLVYAATGDFRWMPLRMAVDGDDVWTEFRFTMTQTGDFPGIRATGNAVDITGVAIDTIRDGRIAHHRQYFNLASFLQQVGLMPPLI